jgi:hypothetical protein
MAMFGPWLAGKGELRSQTHGGVLVERPIALR